MDRGERKHQRQTTNHISPSPGRDRDRLLRHVKLFGTVWAALLAIDISTGAGFWAHWPGIVIATIWGIDAVLLYLRDRKKRMIACSAVIVCGLAMINLVTWSGYPWVLWPAGLLVVIEIIRRSGFPSNER